MNMIANRLNHGYIVPPGSHVSAVTLDVFANVAVIFFSVLLLSVTYNSYWCENDGNFYPSHQECLDSCAAILKGTTAGNCVPGARVKLIIPMGSTIPILSLLTNLWLFKFQHSDIFYKVLLYQFLRLVSLGGMILLSIFTVEDFQSLAGVGLAAQKFMLGILLLQVAAELTSLYLLALSLSWNKYLRKAID